MAQVARFYQWSEADAESLTISRMLFWRDQANAMLDREARTRRNVR